MSNLLRYEHIDERLDHLLVASSQIDTCRDNVESLAWFTDRLVRHYGRCPERELPEYVSRGSNTVYGFDCVDIKGKKYSPDQADNFISWRLRLPNIQAPSRDRLLYRVGSLAVMRTSRFEGLEIHTQTEITDVFDKATLDETTRVITYEHTPESLHRHVISKDIIRRTPVPYETLLFYGGFLVGHAKEAGIYNPQQTVA